MENIQEMVVPGAIAAGAVVVGAVAAPFVVTGAVAVAGFGSSGIVAGSIAAGVQSSIGVIAAGSAFATLQSIGAAGLSAGATAVVSAVGGIGAAGLVQPNLFFGGNKCEAGNNAAVAKDNVQVEPGNNN
ncbi:hypothetical protein HDV04_001522, partial [Boothiomyces sp. JEL0838]